MLSGYVRFSAWVSAAQFPQWLSVWAAVPPVTAVVYFQPRYGNHPLILQYAMRVLEEYPVELTFFFVPQIVQALRADGLGEPFIMRSGQQADVVVRLCRTVHLRDLQNFAAILPSNHLEYEGEHVQGR